MLKEPLEGPDCTLDDALRAIDYVVPALEVLNSHIELEGRTIVDTIADNAAYGAMVLGDDAQAPRRDRPALGAGAALPQRRDRGDRRRRRRARPPRRPASRGSRTSCHQHGARLEAGEIILAGSFTRPMWVSRGDIVRCDYGPMGTITCRFV